MSYDVSLHDPVTGNLCEMTEQVPAGGTYALGDRRACEFNITYNYAEVFGGLVRELAGRTTAEALPALEAFVNAHPTAKPYEADYWAPTIGNAKAAVEVLVSFSKAHPAGVWRVC